MAKSKEGQIFIGIDDQVIELTGEAKEAFLEDRKQGAESWQKIVDAQKAQKELKIAAYTKLGLTEEEINAIL